MTETILLSLILAFLVWQYVDTRRRLKRLSRPQKAPKPPMEPKQKKPAPMAADPNLPAESPLKRIYSVEIKASAFPEKLAALAPHRTNGYRVPPQDWEERLGFVNPEGFTPRSEVIDADFYPIDAGYLDVEACDKSWHFKVEEYAKHVPFKRGVETVIDTGAGNGSFAAALRRRGVTVLSVDIDMFHAMQQLAATRGLLTMNWNVRAPLPFVPNSFDAAHSNDAFFFFNPAEVCSILGEWDRIVRPGGYFILTFYQVSSTVEAHQRRVAAVDQSADRLGWKVLKRDEAILEADGQEVYYGIFQKPE